MIKLKREESEEGKGTRGSSTEGLADDGKRFLAMDVLHFERSLNFILIRGGV